MSSSAIFKNTRARCRRNLPVSQVSAAILSGVAHAAFKNSHKKKETLDEERGLKIDNAEPESRKCQPK